MEGASVPETDDGKPAEQRPGGDLAGAYDRIKSAEQDLARLDRLVSGMERDGNSPSGPQVNATAEGGNAPPPDKAPAPERKIRHQGLKADRPMLRALVGLLLATGILGAAFASHYRDEARAIVARWAPPAAKPPPKLSEDRAPAEPPAVQLAAADEPTSVPAPPIHEAENVAPTGTTSPDQASSELAQSLKTISSELAGINDKLEQLKSRHEQALREQADAIQQLKTAQEKAAEDNARIAAQVQALQSQLAALPAKPAVRGLTKENDMAARQHVPAAAPRRPRPPREPWMPPPYMVDPYGDPDW
jgi:hypothetical protein